MLAQSLWSMVFEKRKIYQFSLLHARSKSFDLAKFSSINLQIISFLGLFSKSIINDFWQKNIMFCNRVRKCVKSIRKRQRGKQCFLILSLLSHILTGKLIFSQKRLSKTSNLLVAFDAFKCVFWCYQITLLMLYYRAKASSVKIERRSGILTNFKSTFRTMFTFIKQYVLTKYWNWDNFCRKFKH